MATTIKKVSGVTNTVTSPNIYSLDLELSSSQYAYISDASQTGLDLSSDFTIEAWIKLEQLPSTAGAPFRIVSKNDFTLNKRTYELFIDNADDKLVVHFSDSGTSYGSEFKCNVALGGGEILNFIHVAATVDISVPSAKIYFNGIEQAVTNVATADTTIVNTDANFVIGGTFNNGSATQFFDGLINQVRVFSDIRSQAEIVNFMYRDVLGEGNLVGYWKFQNNYLDETTNNNDLTASGSPVFVSTIDSVPFTYFLVGGTDDLSSLLLAAASTQFAYITNAGQTGLNWGSGDGTVEAWVRVKTDTGAGVYVVAIKGAGGASQKRYVMGVDDNMLAYFEIDDDTTAKRVTGGTTLSVNVYYHLTGVRDGNNLRIYVNGKEDTAAVDITGYGSLDSAEAFTVGASNSAGITGSASYFDGRIDQVRVFNDARSATEIKADMFTFHASNANLQGEWDFDGDYLDQTANNNDLTSSGSPTFDQITGFDLYNRRNLKLIAANPDWVAITNGASSGLNRGSGDLTCEAWIYVASDTGTGDYAVMIKGAGGAGQKRYYLHVDLNMKIAFDIDDDTTLKTVVGGTTLSLNTWYHVAGVRDGNNLRVYLNGVEDAVATDITGYGDLDSTEAFTIGATNGAGSTGSNFYFDGRINDVRVWSDARTAAEIKQNMKLQVSASEANLVGNWQFRGNLADRTASKNNLYLGSTFAGNFTNRITPYDGSSSILKVSGVYAGLINKVSSVAN